MYSNQRDKPFLIGCTKLRVRYKKLYPTGRPRGRGRFPGYPGRDRSGKQDSKISTDKLQLLNVHEDIPQEVAAQKEAIVDGNQVANDHNPSIAKASIAPVEFKRNEFVEEHAADEVDVPSETTNANVQTIAEAQPQDSKMTTSEVPSGVPIPIVDVQSSNESTAKGSYYGYYGPSSFPPNYHPHWGYPYSPMYPPMYPVHPYGNPYWVSRPLTLVCFINVSSVPPRRCTSAISWLCGPAR